MRSPTFQHLLVSFHQLYSQEIITYVFFHTVYVKFLVIHELGGVENSLRSLFAKGIHIIQIYQKFH